MAYKLKLKNKLFIFWFGSLISTLLLIGLLFQYMLTELYRENAEKEISQAFNTLKGQIQDRMSRTQQLAKHFASREEIGASLNLISNYEDINNYQAILFDVEKRSLATQVGQFIQSNGLDYAFLHDDESKLTAMAIRSNDVITLIHTSYENGDRKFMQSKLGDDDYALMSAMPDEVMGIHRTFQNSTLSSRLISVDGKLQIESIANVSLGSNEQSQGMASVHFVDVLDDSFFSNVLTRFNVEFRLDFPEELPTGAKDPASELDLDNNASVKWVPYSSGEHFVGKVLVPLDSSKNALLTINQQKSSLFSALSLFINAMLIAVGFVVFILAPLGILYLQKIITTPLAQLVDGIRSLRRIGSDKEINTDSQDELSFLADSAKTMTQEIADRESELRESEARVRLIMDSAAESIYGIDFGGSCTFVNQACLDMLGYSDSAELLGVNMHDLIHHTYPDGTPYPIESSYIYRALKEESGTHNDQEVLWRKNGSFFAAEYWSHPIFREEKCLGAVVTFLDITQRKKAEDLQKNYQVELEKQVAERTAELEKKAADLVQATNLKSEFLANMSHELRTPMNSIIGFTGRVIKKSADKLEPRQLSNLHTVERNAHHLLGLINGLLDLSKIEAGKMEAHAESFELAPLIYEVFSLTGSMLEEKPIELITDLSEDSIILNTDSIKLKQILVNLVSNAMKFTHEGSITISAERLSVVSGADPRISIRVIDTGVGMDDSAIQYIFEAFRQVDGSMTRKVGGTGLGLAIVRSFTDLLGGAITVESEEGVGTQFELVIPTILNDEEVEQPGVEGDFGYRLLPHVDEIRDGRQPILCIDDDPEALELLREYLTDERYRVVTANGGEEGLALAKEVNPFAITLDILMPSKDGWSVLSDLKDCKETRDIPVFVISGMGNKKLAYRLGAIDYMQKPFNPDHLIDGINHLTLGNIKTALLIDDDPLVRNLIEQFLDDTDITSEFAVDGIDALSKLESMADDLPEIIMLDLMMPGMGGFELLEKIHENPAWSAIPIIVITAKSLGEEEHDYLLSHVTSILPKDELSSKQVLKQLGLAMKSLTKNTGT